VFAGQKTSPTAQIHSPTGTAPLVASQTITGPTAPAVTLQPPASTATQAPTIIYYTIIVPPATPTRTPTPAPGRPGPSVSAAYLSSAPVLDGSWEEWNTTAYPATFVVFGRDDWAGAADLEASYRVGWDASFLYLAVKVIDDAYVQNTTGPDLYKGDSLDLLLDTDLLGDFNSTSLSSDDFQLGISAGSPTPGNASEAFLWFPKDLSGSRPKIIVGSQSGGGLYRIEAAIPWSVLGVAPSAGRRLGFALSVSDNDNPAANVQQSMVSNTSGRRLLNPTTWGELTLVQ